MLLYPGSCCAEINHPEFTIFASFEINSLNAMCVLLCLRLKKMNESYIEKEEII